MADSFEELKKQVTRMENEEILAILDKVKDIVSRNLECPHWSKEKLPAGDGILFETEDYTGVGYVRDNKVFDFAGDEVSDAKDIKRWVLFRDVRALIGEEDG